MLIRGSTSFQAISSLYKERLLSFCPFKEKKSDVSSHL